MTRKLHLFTGMALLLFIVSHLAIHLFALAGPAAHNSALKAVQQSYRNPVVEPLLVAALLFQVALGIRLTLRRWREPNKSRWAKIQIASGLYLVYFIINHTSAALYTRHFGQLETNFWWVSGPLLHPVLKWFFHPYYTLAVLSVAAHLGAILHFRFGNGRAARLSLAAGILFASAYLASFGGWLFPVEAKADYRAFYDGLLAAMGVR
jgi:hypothetical protein